MTAVPREPNEVWVRGNARVSGTLAAVAIVCTGIAVTAVLLAGGGGSSPTPWWIVAGAAGVTASGAFLLAWASARPRLVRRGNSLVVQVSPVARETVPLDIVECFFPGSNRLGADGGPAGGEQAAFRVGTLVIRLAERALDYRKRGTFPPWVTWDDSCIVLDGRWCERLTPEFARELGSRLVAAKRVAAGDVGR